MSKSSLGLRKDTWNEIYISNHGQKIYCYHYFTSKDALNVMITHTPVVSTFCLKKAYESLSEYGVNIFAFDCRGIGKSEGQASDFNLDSLISDMDAVFDYIEQYYSDQIHMFGYTGIGGIFGQYYVCQNNKIKSFAQFACARYGDVEPLGYPKIIVKMLYSMLKMLTAVFPNLKFNFNEPKYTGYNAEKDNGFYKEFETLYPDFRRCNAMLILALLNVFMASDSLVKTKRIFCPTLVFKTMHDRYFSRRYFDEYYNDLPCEKKLVEVDDVHNSYFFNGDIFCREAVEWFKMHM